MRFCRTPRPITKHGLLLGGQPEELKSVVQAVLITHQSSRLERQADIGKAEFHTHGFAGEQLRRDRRPHAAIPQIERASGNAIRNTGAQHGHIHRDRNTAASSNPPGYAFGGWGGRDSRTHSSPPGHTYKTSAARLCEIDVGLSILRGPAKVKPT